MVNFRKCVCEINLNDPEQTVKGQKEAGDALSEGMD